VDALVVAGLRAGLRLVLLVPLLRLEERLVLGTELELGGAVLVQPLVAVELLEDVLGAVLVLRSLVPK
jgi:hypothetical protein